MGVLIFLMANVCIALQVDTARRDLLFQMDPGSALQAFIAPEAPPLNRAAGSAARAIIAPQAPALRRAVGSAARAFIAPQAPPLNRAAPVGGSAARAIIALKAPPLQRALPVGGCAIVTDTALLALLQTLDPAMSPRAFLVPSDAPR
jgi:hypothetical protein